ncbi:MAG: thiamine diphosphokinase [Coriobacteriales bacterium]|jgi:thiamine pyrophosphokinase
MENQATFDVLIVNGSPRGIAPELLRSLAARSARVVAVDSGVRWAIGAGLVPDLLIGDMDSAPADVLAACDERNVPRVQVDPVAKNETDLELALAHVRGEGARRIAVTNFLGGRIDHELASMGALARSGLDVTGFEDGCTVGFLCDGVDAGAMPGELRPVELGVRLGDEFSVVALWGSARVTQSGVRYPQDGAELGPLSGLGISNVLESEDAFVRVEEGRVAVIAPHAVA